MVLAEGHQVERVTHGEEGEDGSGEVGDAQGEGRRGEQEEEEEEGEGRAGDIRKGAPYLTRAPPPRAEGASMGVDEGSSMGVDAEGASMGVDEVATGDDCQAATANGSEAVGRGDRDRCSPKQAQGPVGGIATSAPAVGPLTPCRRCSPVLLDAVDDGEGGQHHKTDAQRNMRAHRVEPHESKDAREHVDGDGGGSRGGGEGEGGGGGGGGGEEDPLGDYDRRWWRAERLVKASVQQGIRV